MTSTAALLPKSGATAEGEWGHKPVMLSEALEGLSLKPGGIYVDGTLGMGGHTEAILSSKAEVGLVIGLDWDIETLERSRKRLSRFGDRVRLLHSNFTRISDVLISEGVDHVDGMLLDLGYSSFHLEKSGRGFSFSREEPLDMRMDRSGSVTAADMVNELPAERLAELIRIYGEERWAKKIAQFIEARRSSEPILTSADLARIVSRAIPRRYHPRRIHPATRTFQALRIAVNRELDNLKDALDLMPSCLKLGGRLCIISFHSLEDRLVKRAFREDARLRVLTKKPLVAAPEEIAKNPRARSAKLRIAERAERPAQPKQKGYTKGAGK